MADASLAEQLVKAFTSTECIAAFLGAFAAFMLEAMRRWWVDRRAMLAAGNETVFALSQMYSHVTRVYQQQFVDHAEEFRKLAGRDPSYAEIMPLEAGDGVVRVPLAKLGFLLRSHDPDLLNRLAAADADFGVHVKVMELRNAAQVQWQSASASVFAQPDFQNRVPQLEVLEDAAGVALSFRLKSLTEALQQGLPDCSKNLKSAGEQLTVALSFIFPLGLVTTFTHAERRNAVERPPGLRKPRCWRRAVRFLYRLGRKPIGFRRQPN